MGNILISRDGARYFQQLAFRPSETLLRFLFKLLRTDSQFSSVSGETGPLRTESLFVTF